MPFPFQIMNTSSLAVHFSIKMDSQSLLQYSKAQMLPDFINSKEEKDNEQVNFVGKSIFHLKKWHVVCRNSVHKKGHFYIRISMKRNHIVEIRQSDLHNGISYTNKIISLFWNITIWNRN